MAAVPSPVELDGGRFWCTASVELAGHSVTLPVSAGRIVWQADQWPGTQISGLTVPRFDDEDTDVYGAGLVGSDGHRVRIQANAESAAGSWSWGLGEFLVNRVTPGPVSLEIDAIDLTELVIRHEARVPRPVHQTARPVEVMATLLAEDNINFWFDPSLPLPRIRDGFALGTDRGETLQELSTMWGVFLYPHSTGGLGAFPLPSGPISEPVARFSELDASDSAPIIDSVLDLDRSQIFNHVIVPVRDSEKVAEAYQTTGCYAVDRYGWQSLRLDSNAVGHYAEAQGMALTQLAKSLLRTVTRPVESVPDWRVAPYSPVAVETHADGEQWGRVTGFELPLTHGETAVYHVGMEV
ncbi:hypothetical protein EJ997_10295 [Flaviflexus ciconiae]|uniref:DUF5047 domain-containing protein n=1 Tax=Flaviflexus ciconiae TaxID=2496867 RepID=A0A3Q9G552_9ACTO|nr:hypothetical protein [Flaviflexus ciconiae]AZQ77673.1 hypothetical protein EJ997_10295 [Flaviflexus ciconiae]